MRYYTMEGICMDEMFGFVDKIPDWLRWVLLLPAVAIVNILFVSLLSIASFIFPQSEIFAITGTDEILRPLGEPIIGFFVATNFAPKGKIVVGIIVIVFFFIILGLFLASTFILLEYYMVGNIYLEVAKIIAHILGPIIPLVYLIFNSKKYLEKDSISES